jgi:hypothetical protein
MDTLLQQLDMVGQLEDKVATLCWQVEDLQLWFPLSTFVLGSKMTSFPMIGVDPIHDMNDLFKNLSLDDKVSNDKAPSH